MCNSKTKDQAKRMVQDMQKVGALYKLCDQYGIKPITRSPNKHLETGKIENISRSSFALCIPLDLDDGGHALPKVEYLSLLRLLYEVSQFSLPYTTMGKLEVCNIFEMLILSFHLFNLMNIST
jgi:hypothetical protein